MVISRQGIVATSQTLASQAGAQILARGGSAMDAAIAANAVLGVVEPMSDGIGGDLFAIYWDAKTGKLTGINASGWAPKALSIEYLRQKGISQHAAERHPVGDGAGLCGRLGKAAPEIRQAAVARSVPARDLLRRERISGDGDDRGCVGPGDCDARAGRERPAHLSAGRRARPAWARCFAIRKSGERAGV